MATYRELAILMNIVSASTIKGYPDLLKKKWYVDWQEGMPRTLHLLENKGNVI